MNSAHDVGGMDGFGPIEIEENEPVFHEPWEGRVRAMFLLGMRKFRLYNHHETRYVVDRMNPVFYLGSSYYEKWLFRLETALKENGVLSEEQIRTKMAQLSPQITFKSELESYRKVINPVPSSERRAALQTTSGTKDGNEQVQPRFSPGTVVKAKEMSPLGHTRIPRYIRGKQGVVERIHGTYLLPDVKVHEGIDLYQPVYWVSFDAQDLWGEDASTKDKLYIELWEDYLEPGGTKNE